MKPLCIELFAGTFGWSKGWLEQGGRVIGYDIEHLPHHGEVPDGADLILQDVKTIDGRRLKDAELILASPPCPEYSYMAMPWRRAKQIARALRGEDVFPTGYKGSRTIEELTALFNECFRIQKEASEAKGQYIPMVVENVKGAQPWVGKARWLYGSFALWGDVPALMPIVRRPAKNQGGSWFEVAHNTTSGHSKNPVHELAGRKHGGDCFSDPSWPGKQGGLTGTKQPGIGGPRENGKGDAWFQDGAARHGSKSTARKAASAQIAKIPERLSRWIAAYYRPDR